MDNTEKGDPILSEAGQKEPISIEKLEEFAKMLEEREEQMRRGMDLFSQDMLKAAEVLPDKIDGFGDEVEKFRLAVQTGLVDILTKVADRIKKF